MGVRLQFSHFFCCGADTLNGSGEHPGIGQGKQNRDHHAENGGKRQYHQHGADSILNVLTGNNSSNTSGSVRKALFYLEKIRAAQRVLCQRDFQAVLCGGRNNRHFHFTIRRRNGIGFCFQQVHVVRKAVIVNRYICSPFCGKVHHTIQPVVRRGCGDLLDQSGGICL